MIVNYYSHKSTRIMSDKSLIIKPEGPYYEGVFPDPPQICATGSPWDSEVWISHIKEYAAILRGEVQPKRTLLSRLKYLVKRIIINRPDCPQNIPAICGILKKRAKTRIIDVGGGFGDNYHYISLLLGDQPLKNIEYHVVDNQRSIDIGKEFFSLKANKPIFHSEIPKGLTFDIVICIGTLQYIENYPDFIAALCKLCNGVIYLSRSPLSRHEKSFFTIQTICPPYGEYAGHSAGKCPVSVINLNELISIFETNNFILTYKHLAEDYSANFSKLPKRFNEADYFDLMFTKRTGHI